MKNERSWTSLVVQWIGVHLPMQGTLVQSLVQEDSTCQGAAKPVHHSDWAHSPRACTLQPEKPPFWKPCSLWLESSLLAAMKTQHSPKLIHSLRKTKDLKGIQEKKLDYLQRNGSESRILFFSVRGIRVSDFTVLRDTEELPTVVYTVFKSKG